MSTLKTLTAASFAAAFAISGAAFAQETSADHFAASDANADNVLNLEEFTAYVSAKADSGDAAYADVRDNGDIEATFGALDANADGVLEKAELGM